MPLINELIETAQTAGAYIMAAAVVGFFAAMAVMLYAWRKTALDDRDS